VRVPLTQGQFDALVSLCFNIGGSGFRKSTVVRRLNEGNYRGAADAFLMWNKPPEIMGRRRSEYKQFLAATSKSAAGAPVRFVAAEEMEEGESVSLDYLRAAGSRTVTAADKIKTGAVSIGVGDALDVASRAKGLRRPGARPRPGLGRRRAGFRIALDLFAALSRERGRPGDRRPRLSRLAGGAPYSAGAP
jgi:hypothetical protein